MKTSSAVLLVLFFLVIYVLSLFLVESGKTVSLKETLAKRRRDNIVAAARKRLRTTAAPKVTTVNNLL